VPRCPVSPSPPASMAQRHSCFSTAPNTSLHLLSLDASCFIAKALTKNLNEDNCTAQPCLAFRFAFMVLVQRLVHSRQVLHAADVVQRCLRHLISVRACQKLQLSGLAGHKFVDDNYNCKMISVHMVKLQARLTSRHRCPAGIRCSPLRLANSPPAPVPSCTGTCQAAHGGDGPISRHQINRHAAAACTNAGQSDTRCQSQRCSCSRQKILPGSSAPSARPRPSPS